MPSIPVVHSTFNTLTVTNAIHTTTTSNLLTAHLPEMAPLASATDSWTITSSPMDGVRPNSLILKHKIDLVSHQDGPFVALFVHERDEAKLLAYWQKVGGRDAKGLRGACPLRIVYAHRRRGSGQGTEYSVQYVGYHNDGTISQWEPESKVLEAQWD
ncbi:hypothetical protein FOXG_21860 [Fusarium oxysporum f. sp. lycopersici 4287]|uniref:Chromo domain-containing protein n=1 Tax=Fusarium oxysporum f. sp. lycopersici (strain 4287 / CBS 123668 / FGSC 9935 / NRRL 34936) TaxID=426428 RepID=A0A0J9W2B7_FUSO4|nr:hypothetical protein FOXG_21860 [Fusarium oxysporum f. sp. lycopersici 4287]KNB17036.1 hypothetical protein FOXG_21860 [Fusarium oxysporum f. sp. lycopersici 4287]